MKNAESVKKSMQACIRQAASLADLICDQADTLHHRGFDKEVMHDMRYNANRLTKVIHEYSAYSNVLNTK